jgi:hypothetical protein
MNIQTLLAFGGMVCLVLWFMFRAQVRIEEGPPLDTELWLRAASAALLVCAMLCFAASAAFLTVAIA